MSKCLTAEAIFSAQDGKIEAVDVSAWWPAPGIVYVRTLSGEELDQFDADGLVKQGRVYVANMQNRRARLVVLAACDEGGSRLFQDKDLPAVAKKSGAALSAICEVARRLNRMDSEAMMEEAEKNSERGPGESDGIAGQPPME